MGPREREGWGEREGRSPQKSKLIRTSSGVSGWSSQLPGYIIIIITTVTCINLFLFFFFVFEGNWFWRLINSNWFFTLLSKVRGILHEILNFLLETEMVITSSRRSVLMPPNRVHRIPTRHQRCLSINFVSITIIIYLFILSPLIYFNSIAELNRSKFKVLFSYLRESHFNG